MQELEEQPQLQQLVQALITMEELEVMALKEAHQPPQNARLPQLVRCQHLHLAQAAQGAAVALAQAAAVAAAVAAEVLQLHASLTSVA
jgi:hypothetical protein